MCFLFVLSDFSFSVLPVLLSCKVLNVLFIFLCGSLMGLLRCSHPEWGILSTSTFISRRPPFILELGWESSCSPLFTSRSWWGWPLTLHPSFSAAEDAGSAALLRGRGGQEDLSLSAEASNQPASFPPSVFWCLLYVFPQGCYLYLAGAMG